MLPHLKVSYEAVHDRALPQGQHVTAEYFGDLRAVLDDVDHAALVPDFIGEDLVHSFAGSPRSFQQSGTRMGHVCLYFAAIVEYRCDAVLQAALREEATCFQLVTGRVDAVDLRDFAMMSHA